MRKRVYLTAWLPIILEFTSCSAPATSLPATATPTALSTPTVASNNTPAPSAVELSSLPGFEGWSVFNAPAADVTLENHSLILTLKHRALWFMNQRGVLAYKPLEGDFKITASVYTSKSSDRNQPPGGDGTVQLGGIMACAETGGQENYVFIVMGGDGNGLSVETKNTTDNVSEYEGPAWDSSNAQLRICRSGQTFHLYKRQVDREEPWMSAALFDRPDLPASLQVGLNIYSDSTPDLQVCYENIKIEKLASPSECETS